MILRTKRISPNAAEISLQMSFGKVDVLRWLRDYAAHFDCLEPEDRKNIINTEGDFRHYFLNSPLPFGIFQQEKHREQLFVWMMNRAVTEKFLIRSATDENAYLFADILFIRKGRPKEE